MNMLRYIWMLPCLTLLAAHVIAQPLPPSLTPPPAPPSAPTRPPSTTPPPLPEFGSEPELEPQVTIIRRENDTLEEVRVNGELRYIRVTPRRGKPYFLVPNGNGQTYLRYDSLDGSLKPSMWQLFSW